MFKMTATLSALLLSGTAAFAEAHVTTPASFEASDLLGMRVFAGDSDLSQGEWNDIGEINDILVTLDGTAPAAIIGVGGFLGVGEKDVAIDLSRLSVVMQDGAPYLVVAATAEDLEASPAYERVDLAMVAAAPADMPGKTAGAPAIARDGFSMLAAGDVTSEMLMGALIYDANDEEIGEVDDVVLSDGQITEVTLDVARFLGLDEKAVAIPMENLTVLQNGDGSEVRVYVDADEDSLMSLPDYIE